MTRRQTYLICTVEQLSPKEKKKREAEEAKRKKEEEKKRVAEQKL